MHLSSSQLDRRMIAFKQVCRQSGLKLTHQRTEIFRELAGTDEHPDADTVYRRVRERVPAVSLDTVYRTLDLLESLGLLRRVEVLCDRARFDANVDEHPHFVCVECGLIRDLHVQRIQHFRVPDEVKSWGKVDSVHLELRGVCSKCMSAKADTSQ